MRWEILYKKNVKDLDDLNNILLRNRGLTTKSQKEEFLHPINPMKITLKSLGIKGTEVSKAIERIKLAKKKKEHVIIYGDYDADGITGVATLWEVINSLGVFVLPHIPERFSEGYGLNMESVKKLKENDPKLGLIITVDHGITAGDKIFEVKKLGIDVIIADHHQIGEKMPRPLALIFTTKIGGSGIAWFFAREIVSKFRINNIKFRIEERLQLAAIGTIADQLPLVGANRSIVKYGLQELNVTKRPGLVALKEEARITNIGPFEVGFVIAPRINSMGRLKHGIESLRLLCTKDRLKALELAKNVGSTNYERQKMVDEMIVNVREKINKGKIRNVIVIASEEYHEGVIGLAAAKLVEEFYRPAIVLSSKGDIAKASARSIAGFNIIEAIRSLSSLYIEGGGHPMAAGFSIKTENIEIFSKKINNYASKYLTSEVLSKKIKIDLQVQFEQINQELINEVKQFEPTGLGNQSPTFVSQKVTIVDTKVIGRDGKHLKLKLKQNDHILDSIYFGGGEIYSELTPDSKMDVVYHVEENIWNGYKNIQLKIKDVRPLGK